MKVIRDLCFGQNPEVQNATAVADQTHADAPAPWSEFLCDDPNTTSEGFNVNGWIIKEEQELRSEFD